MEALHTTLSIAKTVKGGKTAAATCESPVYNLVL